MGKRFAVGDHVTWNSEAGRNRRGLALGNPFMTSRPECGKVDRGTVRTPIAETDLGLKFVHYPGVLGHEFTGEFAWTPKVVGDPSQVSEFQLIERHRESNNDHVN